MAKRKKFITFAAIVIFSILITWLPGWIAIYGQRRAHKPVCFPIAPFVVVSHDTNKIGPAADGIYLAYLFGVHRLGERVTWRCN